MSTEKKRKEGTGHGVELQDRQKVEPPKKYKVVLHNDDFTPMDFVVDVLRDVFNYGNEKAQTVMLQVHQEGKGIAGVYSKEIASIARSCPRRSMPWPCKLFTFNSDLPDNL